MKKKIVAAALACILCIGVGIGGTLAWLTTTSKTVTNTFTVGDIKIVLDESKLNEDGTLATGTRVQENAFKIVPGGKGLKDPTLTVQKGSEKCYVYVSVENNVVLNGVAVVTPNIDTANWIKVGSNGNETVYRYKEIVDASAANVPLAVFTEVSYSNTITKDDIDDLANTKIIINGYAHQSDNLELSVADAAANTHFGTTAPTT